MVTRDVSGGSSGMRDSDPTVLFVDDEPELLDLYEVLYDADFTVLTAESGEQAISMFGGHIDFAFFDRQMPELTGGAAIRRLREEGYETPMGIISAVDPEGDLAVDHDAYFTKPPGREQIRETVTQSLSE